MKKILLPVVLFLLILITLAGFQSGPYPFKEPVNEIESIEIVSAESSLEFTVVKTLSETEKQFFLQQFQTIDFYQYFGDPSKLYGDSIKITYSNGDYEMICSYTSEYVKDGSVHFLFKRCNEEAFNDLRNSFLS